MGKTKLPAIAENTNLFIVDMEYSVPMSDVRQVIEPHLEFIRRTFAEGRFIASDAKVPRTGGVIVMVAESDDAARDCLALDPFVTPHVAEYRLTEFLPSNVHDALK